MTIEIVNIHRDRLFGMHLDDVYIGRAGRGFDGYFGNPVRVGVACPECGRIHTSPGDTLPCYTRYLDRRLSQDAEFRRRVARLRGKRLGCFCKPKPCHGDVLAARAASLPPRVVSVDFRLASPPIGERAATFAKLLGLDPARMRWTKTREGVWLASSSPGRVVRVNFAYCTLSEPCRCERGRHTQCRACYNGFQHQCECHPCAARRGGRRAWDWGDDDDGPSETEILGVVGDR